MKILTPFLLLLSVCPLSASPCDGNPRIGANGLSMTCTLTQPVVLDPNALNADAHATLNLALAASTPDTLVFSVEIGYTSPSGANRKTVIIRKPSAGISKVATTIDIPVGATIEFVQIEEFTRSNSSGFIQ